LSRRAAVEDATPTRSGATSKDSCARIVAVYG
jgi:hypothetical protein